MAAVDFEQNKQDVIAVGLALYGFSILAAEQSTGLSTSQVAYRTRKGQASRKAYRDGETEEAKLMIQLLSNPHSEAAKLVKNHLSKVTTEMKPRVIPLKRRQAPRRRSG